MQDPLTPEWRARVDAAAAVVIREMHGETVDPSDEPSRSPPETHSSRQLSKKQEAILSSLRDGMRKIDIARKLGVGAGYVSNTVFLLETKGFIRKGEFAARKRRR